MKLKATNQYHSTPISKKLASNFVELGYGLQAEGMAAEMFFNRSFEPFYPYRDINKIWFDLLENEEDLTSRCETDWRVFDWYHSSYEHNAWFAFPGTAGYQPITDDATFVIEKSPNRPSKTDGSEFYLLKLFNSGQQFFNVCVGTRDYVRSNYFAKSRSCSGTSFYSCLNCANVAANHNAYQTATDLFATDKYNVCSLYHCICCFDCCYQTSGFNHT